MVKRYRPMSGRGRGVLRGKNGATRAERKIIAEETVAILDRGWYALGGKGRVRVDLSYSLEAARSGTEVVLDPPDTSLTYSPSNQTLVTAKNDSAVLASVAGSDAANEIGRAIDEVRYAQYILALQRAAAADAEEAAPDTAKPNAASQSAPPEEANTASDTADGSVTGISGNDGDGDIGAAAAVAVEMPGAAVPPVVRVPPLRIEVKLETTLAGCQRLNERGYSVAALNFASAKNPGGGFLRGSIAQEESLALATGLYHCIGGQTSPARPLYARNRADNRHCLYHHTLAFSPRVPLFRDEDTLALLPRERVGYAGILTCPAPNARHATEHVGKDAVRAEMLERVRRLVSDLVARPGVDALVLGAYGCGVFGNDRADVACCFAVALAGRQGLREVRFSVTDPDTAAIFRDVFGIDEGNNDDAK